MSELYKKYRPTKLSEVFGQPETVQTIKDLLKRGFPHACLLTGGTGMGKTTLARIIAQRLECGGSDLHEYNSANLRGIETVRLIASKVNGAPLSGKARVWLVDESHKLTNDAQNAFLKLLEDPPAHAYFILCTTEENKMIAAVRSRCTHLKVTPLKTADLKILLANVTSKEKVKLSDDVYDRIIEVSEGSARKALVILEQVMGMETEEQQLKAIMSVDAKNEAIEIYKKLIDSRTQWLDMAKTIKSVEQEPEDIRRLVLACANNGILAGGRSAGRCFLIIQAFRDNYFDCGKSGLAASCYEVINTK